MQSVPLWVNVWSTLKRHHGAVEKLAMGYCRVLAVASDHGGRIGADAPAFASFSRQCNRAIGAIVGERMEHTLKRHHGAVEKGIVAS